MAIKEIEVSSVAAFIGAVGQLKREWHYDDPWFRGHMKAAWRLAPSLYRLHGDETELRIEFQRVGSQLISERQPSTQWDWYFLMQHHGAPTRLLDWTDGSFIALYFAVGGSGRPRPGRRGDAAVWVLNPEWLNSKSRSIGRRIALPDKDEVRDWLPGDPLDEEKLMPNWPLAIDPPHVARRLAVQRSHFTIFGTHKNGLTHLAEQDPRGRLARITVRRSSFGKIQRELATCGIHESVLFPDLDALSREIRDDFCDRQ